MLSTRSQNSDSKTMNEKHVIFLIKQVRYYLDELEAEIRNHPESYVPYDDNLYKAIKYSYEHYQDDDGWTD